MSASQTQIQLSEGFFGKGAMGKMIRVAVVDDSPEDAQRLAGYLQRFEKEQNMEIQTTVYLASVEFLEKYHGQFDVIFLDIEMPGSDGLSVAKEIRQQDQQVGIIFVTSLAQYAISGYEVNAIDFMVKPMGYYNFSTKLEKAVRYFQSHKTKDLLISSGGNIRRIAASDIIYMEKSRDNVVFHTKTENFTERGSIKAIKEKVTELPFSECTSGCLVNLACVTRVGKDSVTVTGGVELPLSRRLKRQFTEEYVEYVGGVL